MTLRQVVLAFLVLLAYTVAQGDNCTVTIDAAIGACEDSKPLCPFWAARNECETNPDFMLRVCAKSCNSCRAPGGVDEPLPKDNSNGTLEDGVDDDFGVEQTMDQSRRAELIGALSDMKLYFQKLRNNPDTTPHMHELLDNCKNKHENCAFWKVLGECENNPGYMKVNCAPVCMSCEMLSIEARCPVDPEAPVVWKSGDLNKYFLSLTSNPDFQKYEPKVHSRPDYAEGDTPETADYKIGPWVVTFDNFVAEEEADRLVELGANEGYKRSSDVGKLKFDGTFENNVNTGRTSTNAWCQHECYNDTLAQQVIQRITEVTNIPEENSEFLQLLRYEEGQYYQTHHDLIPHQLDRQPGVRIMTFYMYLNDVEEGGGTQFPRLGITVTPKKGRALMWPSVMDEDPNKKDPRTEHQAMKVIKGVKYGANAWIHQRDFKGPNKNGCQ